MPLVLWSTNISTQQRPVIKMPFIHHQCFSLVSKQFNSDQGAGEKLTFTLKLKTEW